MPSFGDLVDQERPARLIKAALCKGKIPSAFLFTGQNGTGKKTAALSFAKACNCIAARQRIDRASTQNDPCGTCRPCQKISAGTHPDIHIVRPLGTIIKVEQIRSLCSRLALKPNEASVRLALIEDAHLMNSEAGNTLLKTLEEPPESTVFVLTAHQTSDLLPTIVSRCRHIHFNLISKHRLASFIIEKYKLDSKESNIISAMAGGSFTKAAEMVESGWIKKRNWVIGQVEFLSFNSIQYALAFSETLSKNKKWLTDAFYIMKIWYRDIAVAKISPGNIVNKDLLERIQDNASRATVEKTLSNIGAIELAERNIISNTNVRTTLDALVISIFGENY